MMDYERWSSAPTWREIVFAAVSVGFIAGGVGFYLVSYSGVQ